MNESIMSRTPPLLDTGSPPPKCAICLGVCSNKCFSDSCMHEFCFSCLMEWSKIKAECPLCKKPFKSILHNIKSNEDYEEYTVADTVPTPGPFLDLEDNDFLYLPQLPPRHFQFRTTFTVDPGGELAIQQMLLSHPLTTNNYNFPLLPRYRSRHGGSRSRGVSSATSFRRSIYALNYWVSAPPDLTGRFRDVRPEFYRDNPSARNRLVPWLNRELNALLRENTQQVMNVVDIIMEHLPRWHIRSRSFRNLLLTYMNDKTDHFLHEFYNFMRSPYDMIGYDHHISYSEQPLTYTFTISDYDDDEDSDVAIVNVSDPITIDNNPFRQPTIEVIEIQSSDSSHESDVIIREAPVEVVDLVQSDSENNDEGNDLGGKTPTLPYRDGSESSDHTKPVLPLKIRLKRKRQSREKSLRKKKKPSKRYSSCSTCSDSESSSSSSDSSHHRFKKRHKYKRVKYSSRNYKESKFTTKEKYRTRKFKKISSSGNSSSSSTTTSTTSSSSTSNDVHPVLPKKRKSNSFYSDDNIPLAKIRNKEIQNRSASHTVTSKSTKSVWVHSMSNSEPHIQPSCSMWQNSLMSSPTLLPEEYGYNFPSSSMYNYQFPPMQHFPVDNRPSYSMYQPSTSHFAPESSSGFLQPRSSYTPPIETKFPFFKSDYRYENMYNQENHPPVCVNVGVGTSPIKDTDSEDYLSCAGPSSSSSGSARVQNLVVKKEQALLTQAECFLYNSDTSDSDS